MKKTFEYTAVFKKENKGKRYTVSFPALPGCFTFGNNLKHAKKMAQEVLELWLEVLSDEFMPIPIENKSKDVYVCKMKATLLNN